MNVLQTHIDVLKRILNGDTWANCAKDYHYASQAAAQGLVRHLLDTLKEHTDIDIESSAAIDYLLAHKEALLHYIQKPLPKVTITRSARKYLRETFGKYYVSTPDIVAKQWDTIDKDLTTYYHRRERQAIQTWLASEGYLVGDYADKEMLDYAKTVLTEQLKTLNKHSPAHEKGAILGCQVTDIQQDERSQSTLATVTVTLSKGQHQVKKRIALQLLGY